MRQLTGRELPLRFVDHWVKHQPGNPPQIRNFWLVAYSQSCPCGCGFDRRLTLWMSLS